MYAVLIVVFLLGLCVLYFRRPRYRNLPPGPKGPPFIGVSRQLGLTTVQNTLDKWEKTYGPIYFFTAMGVNSLVLSDATLIRKAFSSAKYQDVFNDRNASFTGKYIFLNFSDIGFALYDDELMTKRKMFHKGLHFYGEGVERFETQVTEHLSGLVEELKRHGGEELDPQLIVHASIIRLIITLITGHVAMEGDETLVNEYFAKLNPVMNPTFDALLMTFPFLRLVPGRIRETYQQIIEYRDRMLHKFYESHKASYEPGKEIGLGHSLMTMRTEAGLRDDNVKALIMDVIGGGIITSTNLILAIILTLIHYQKCFKRLQEEVDDVVGRDRPPLLTDRPYMPYTDATILEALRFTTHFPYLPHRSMADVEFQGYTIPKGTQVIANTWTINHDETLWKDPWTFNPGRFLDEDGMLYDATHPIRQRLLSFGVGKRGCPGESLGLSRLFLYVSTIAQQFDIVPGPTQPPSPDPRGYNQGGIIHTPPSFKCRFIARQK